MNRKNLISKGNESLTIGALWGLGTAAVCPCPVCLLTTGALMLNGIREKLSDG